LAGSLGEKGHRGNKACRFYKTFTNTGGATTVLLMVVLGLTDYPGKKII